MGKRGKKLYIPIKVSLKSASFNSASQRGFVLLPGSQEIEKRRVLLLYVSWFREVGNESYHHAYINTGAYSDGEGSKEQSPPGGDVGQREISFVHRLGGLEKRH